MSIFHRFHQGHENLKNAVHSYWRQNTFLSPRGKAGKFVMASVYFSLPVIFGYVVVNKIVDNAERNALSTIGGNNNTADTIPQTIKTKNSVQEVNRINLERFLRKQQKQMTKKNPAVVSTTE